MNLLLFLLFAAAEDPVKFDNDIVRVLKVTVPPGKKSPPHTHEMNRVMIYLDAGAIDIGYRDGKVEHNVWKAGQVAWSPKSGLHTSDNVGGTTVRVVEIELKQPAPVVPHRRDPKLDPVSIDPEHNILLVENDQVRVFRSWREPGATEPMHEHTGRGRLAVLLTDIDARVLPGASEMKDVAGTVHWTAGPARHAGKNVGKSRFEMILVEVK
jgi:quercetin dioxygenase-like cupin family protein